MPIDTPFELLTARNTIATLADQRSRLISGPMDRARRRDLARVDLELAGRIGGIFDLIDPCDAAPDVPLVLLPVRVQTKMKPGTSTLRVRITPDEVHIDSLLRSITEPEKTAGQAYWTALWSGAEAARAWGELVSAVGARRAGWIAHATRPTNPDQRGAAPPAFPDSPVEIADGTVARCLPDHFVVRVYPQGAEPITVSGSPIARDLSISPIALGDNEVVDAGGLKVPAGSEWTVDFDQAVAVGMGVEVELPPGTTVIDTLVVVGTRRSVSEQQNAADFADLLTSHSFTDGFSLPAAGTPTNNAEADRSPYRPDATAGPPPTVPLTPSADAGALGRLLGVDATIIENLLDTEEPRSSLGAAQQAANTALWFATWGPVLDRIDDASQAVTPANIESARRAHRDHVRGAGHAPAVRIGAQPYGVLPVTDLHHWTPRAGETTARLVPLVERAVGRWVIRSRSLPHIGPGDDVSDEALLDMLGTSPVALGVRARPAVDGAQLSACAAAVGADQARVRAELQITRAMLAQYSPTAAAWFMPPSLNKESRTIALPLVSERDAEVIDQILADRSPAVDSVLQALLDIAWDTAKAAGLSSAPEAYVPPLLDLLTIPPDIAAMVQAAATPGSAAPQPDWVFAAADSLRSTVHFAGQPTDRISLAAIEPVPEIRTSLAQVALDLGDTAEARWIGQNAIAGILDAFATRGEVSAAMTALGAMPIEERRIAVASALDVASHRVDAWATALASSRLPGDAEPAMTLGAFGYVEDIRLGTRGREAQGWLHAPSSSHAVAAGMLASAKRSNIGAKDGREPFAIDLSSRRGTELRRVLEGVKAGQPIGALLGYQIERALTGSAARFQLTLRELAPLITDELDNDLAEADRSTRVAAANVVDGVGLLRQFPVESLTGAAPPLKAKLGVRPANAYIPDGGWDAVSAEEWDCVVGALQSASATLDAVADALLSESVLQYVSGNPARAGAAMDAMAAGGSVDPELAVLRVRQPGRTLTHTMFTVIPVDATGWSTTRPRAIAEPRLEAWAAQRLGDPAAIIVTDAHGVRHTLAEAGFAALDLVFSDDLTTLDRDLRAAIAGMGDTPLAENRGDDWPVGAMPIVAAATLAATLRGVVSGGNPLSPNDLVRPGAGPQRTIDVDDLLRRCDALLDALEEVLEAGEAVIATIDPESHAVDEADVGAVAEAVSGLAAFGVPLLPDRAIPTNAGWAWGAWHTAAARLDNARAVLDDIRAPRDTSPSPGEFVDAAAAVAQGILGDGFRMLPLLEPVPGPDDFVDALTAPALPAPAPARIGAFVRDHATVRAGVGRLAEAQLLGRALSRPAALTVVQLTERDAGVAAPGTGRWLAGPLPDDTPWPSHSAAHLVVELVSAAAGFRGRFAGLAFDSWVETLPFQPDARAFAEGADADNPLRAARATTGLAVHANQASARAPQVVLSAVSPDGARWTTDSVVRAVLSAVDVAKSRLVTLEKVPGDAAILPAIYVASPWLQPRKGFAFGELAAVTWNQAAAPFLSEVK
ncbi:hypothetical protein ACTWP6_25470 [Mycobacterium sp. 4D054]|uniref:hypothetical protein n=1 Tax=Mycobacterium sp. 4D054 TaxID=3457440 RepID=UPI003FD0942F